MSEAGETMFSVCSAWVSQLMKSCSELWKSVASVKASSSFTCRQKTSVSYRHYNLSICLVATALDEQRGEGEGMGGDSLVPNMTSICTEEVHISGEAYAEAERASNELLIE